MEQRKTNTKIAGVDVGKSHLDAAVHGREDQMRVDNAPGGFSELIGWLKGIRMTGATNPDQSA